MTINNRPDWLLGWPEPCLPWAWVVITLIGLGLIVFWLRSRKIDTSDRPECGEGVEDKQELWWRSRRRWALVLGVLFAGGGWYVDLIQYRLLSGEKLWLSAVPTTVWALGYPSWPQSADELIQTRIRQTVSRGYLTALGNQYELPPRSDIMRYIFRQGGIHAEFRTPLPGWQLRLLARRSHTLVRKYHGQAEYSLAAYRYIALSEMYTNDQHARDLLIDGLTDADAVVRVVCLNAVEDFYERAAPYVPRLARLLRDDIERGDLDGIKFMPPQWKGAGKFPYFEIVRGLEMAIGRSGTPGLEVADDWLDDPDPAIRKSAVNMIDDYPHREDLSKRVAGKLVDALVLYDRDIGMHDLIGEVGTSAVDHAGLHLADESPDVRARALRILGIVFFDGPARRISYYSYDPGKQPLIVDDWVERVSDRSFALVLEDIERLATTDPDARVTELATEFMSRHARVGTVEQRRALAAKPKDKKTPDWREEFP